MKCKVHGKLEEDEIYLYIYKNGDQSKQCRVCRLKRKHSSRQKMALNEAWKEKNRIRQRERYWKDPEKARAAYNKKQKEYRDTLHNVYTKKKLKRHFGLGSSQVTDEMVEIKRVMLEIARKKRHKARADEWVAKWRIKRETIRSENKERHRLEKLEQKKLERKKHVDELSDDYVKELLKAQFKSDIDALPKEILDVKRVIVLIKREQKRLKKAVKHCQKHGKLTLSQVNKSRINKSGNYNYKCKICQRELHAQNYERKKQIILEKQREYKQKNPEKVKQMKAESWQRNKHKWKKKNREKENLRRQLETL